MLTRCVHVHMSCVRVFIRILYRYSYKAALCANCVCSALRRALHVASQHVCKTTQMHAHTVHTDPYTQACTYYVHTHTYGGKLCGYQIAPWATLLWEAIRSVSLRLLRDSYHTTRRPSITFGFPSCRSRYPDVWQD